MKNKEIYTYRISLWFIGLLVLSLAACTKTITVPTPITETPIEDPVFSTLDFATPQTDHGKGLAIDGNNLYVVGRTKGNLDGTNQGNYDGILRRYNGGKLWGIQLGTSFFDRAVKVATDSNSDIYVIGDTSGPLGFQVGKKDIFLMKFKQDGEPIWIRQFGTKNFDYVTDIAIDSNNRIYVLSVEGQSSFVIRKFHPGGALLKTKSVTFNYPNSFAPRAMAIDGSNNLIVLTQFSNEDNPPIADYDIKLFKYQSNLNQIWQMDYGTIDIDEYAYDITTDSNNNIYFTLRILDVNQTVVQGARFVKKDANGNTLYSKRLESNTANASNSTIPESITTDSNNNIYIAGTTGGSFFSFENAGQGDIVVFKYKSNGNRQWVSQFDKNNYGSPKFETASDVAVNGVVYITGYTLGNLITGGGTSYGNEDAYVAQLNKSNGTILGVDQ